MKKSVISKLLSELEQLVQVELEFGVEFWLARDLQTVLGYTNWQNFRKVIGDAVTACESSGNKASDHFTEVSKMIALGKGGRRSVEDFMLNSDVRSLLGERNIFPEKLPAAEDLKKVERRLRSEEKKLPRNGGSQ